MRTWIAVLALGTAALPLSAEQPPSVEPRSADSAQDDCTQQNAASERRLPGHEGSPAGDTPECDSSRMPAPRMDNVQPPAPVDRWRVVESLGAPENWRNPYAENNLLKGDRPFAGSEQFFSLTATSNTLVESRRVPVASASSATPRQESQLFTSESASIDAVMYQGDTIFRPPDYQVRINPVVNYSSTRSNGQALGSTTVGAQALFVEKHLRDVSAHYDFDSVRVGIQPLTSDFRGFVLADQLLGVRLFGTRANDVIQYNVGWFRRLPKNANRQNELGAGLPANDLLVANVYVQDLWRAGLTSEFVLIADHSRAPGTQVSLAAPGTAAGAAPLVRHDYDVVYFGYGADGRLGGFNLTGSVYGALGRESPGTFTTSNTHVRSAFAALELSRDFDWMRVRFSALYASGDSDPADGRASGFDGISQSALFAGADSTFFIHQRLALLADRIDLKVRDSLFADLRPTNDPGQSNYTNPGLRLLGIGTDLDLAPSLRVSLDVNHLWFDQTATLTTLLDRSDVERNIGTDFSANMFWRPFNSQNLIVRLTGAKLLSAARPLFGSGAPFSAFANVVLTY